MFCSSRIAITCIGCKLFLNYVMQQCLNELGVFLQELTKSTDDENEFGAILLHLEKQAILHIDFAQSDRSPLQYSSDQARRV